MAWQVVRVRIGFRTVKTAVGVCAAVLLAEGLQLTYATSAGILTLLCIQKTRKQSLTATLERLFACLLALILAMLFFSLFGYHPLVMVPLILVLIPLCVRLRLQGGIASSSVMIMHAYSNGAITIPFLLNELALLVIGLGAALLVNLYMPGLDRQISAYKEEVNRYMAIVLREFAKYLKEGYSLWDGRELIQLGELLAQAKPVAVQEVENNLLGRKEDSFLSYFEAKQQQLTILERMLPFVSRMDAQLEQGIRIGQFMEELSEHLDGPLDRQAWLERLRQIREYHKQLPMPQTRAEFENRANLFGLANELELFLLSL